MIATGDRPRSRFKTFIRRRDARRSSRAGGKHNFLPGSSMSFETGDSYRDKCSVDTVAELGRCPDRQQFSTSRRYFDLALADTRKIRANRLPSCSSATGVGPQAARGSICFAGYRAERGRPLALCMRAATRRRMRHRTKPVAKNTDGRMPAMATRAPLRAGCK